MIKELGGGIMPVIPALKRHWQEKHKVEAKHTLCLSSFHNYIKRPWQMTDQPHLGLCKHPRGCPEYIEIM